MRRAAVGAVITALVTALSIGVVSAAEPNGHWPVVQYNHRGADVVAVQYLLRGWEYTVTVDGVFGSQTKTAVIAFQQDRGLTANGVVQESTWNSSGKELWTILSRNRPGMRMDHIRALQYLLNAKHSAGLTVSGVFGTATEAAVKSFQTHMGLTSDGVVGPLTWKQLTFHYEQMQPGEYLCNPASVNSEEWGHASTVGAVLKAGQYFQARWVDGMEDSLIPFWDTSLEHGGDINGHDSHEVGMDVDIGIIKDNGAQCQSRSGTYLTDPPYHQQATSWLVYDLKRGADFAYDGMIKLIYYSDPFIIDQYGPLVRLLVDDDPTNDHDHDNHLHVRYCTLASPEHDLRYEGCS